MILQFFIGALLVSATVFVHATLLDRLMSVLEHLGPAVFRAFKRMWKIPLLVITVLGVFFGHIIQIWLWAVFYLAADIFSDFETALYFSTSTFTTVGYGDIVLGKEWRLLSSFQSANGFILFGWSTAFIFEVMSKLYKSETIRKTESKSK